MKKRYHSIQPKQLGAIKQELEQCISQIQSLSSDDAQIFKITFFASASDEAHFDNIKKDVSAKMQTSFGKSCPAFTVLAESPGFGYQIVAEVGLVLGHSVNIKHQEFDSYPYVIVSCGDEYRELWVCGLGLWLEHTGTYQSAQGAFEIMRKLLAAEELSFNHIVRQWNYISGILDFEHNETLEYQKYQIFNEVRNSYYQNYRTVEGFPAATGIGVNFGGVTIDFCAASCLSPEKVFSVENPVQVNPYVYGQEVLEGAVLAGTCVKQPPQFERGKLLLNPCNGVFLISGTASIIGQYTIGIDDVVVQTKTTIDHIEKLASVENLKTYIQSSDNHASEYLYIRVYVKRPDDFETVRSICKQRFGNTPALYVQADVCRNNLLVEIEAEMSLIHL